jgi:uncharacterized protein YjiS (DUF1127 family)
LVDVDERGHAVPPGLDVDTSPVLIDEIINIRFTNQSAKLITRAVPTKSGESLSGMAVAATARAYPRFTDLEAAMPVLTSFALTAAVPLKRVVRELGTATVRGLVRMGRAIRNRHSAAMLARLDDRMLADIGITRSDLRDAYSEPLWQDPTDVLAQRARERRSNRRQAAFEASAHTSRAPHQPPADRPARYLT